MKVKSKRASSQASKVFTDREEPRKSFWKNYDFMCDCKKNDEGEIRVLVYYGIGGIGKSSLLNKLMLEMEEKLEEPLYVSFDFDIKQDCRAVLESMKNMLANKYKFSFPLFDMGLYLYAQKIGENVESPEIKGLVSKSPTLDLILSITSELPVIGFTSKVLGIADKAGAYLANLVSSHKKELYAIESKEPTELYQFLPYLFAQDLSDNLEKQQGPLVVFFDTYEQLVNEMAMGNSLNKDLWIRGENGLIQNIPNVLWVIAGREKLKWNAADWGESLEQHILGTLSPIDAENFLENAGISDGKLRGELYQLTKGTPVYLDLCVDRYFSLKDEGVTPSIEQFGDNEQTLIERFVRYMDDAKKEMVYFLSCLDSWTDEMIYGTGNTVLSGSFHAVTYQNVKGLSFISESEDNEYTMHQIVRKVLYENCPEILKKRAIDTVLTYCEDKLKSCNIYSAEFETYLNWTIECATKSLSDEETEAYFTEHLWEYCEQLFRAGRFDSAYIGIDKLYQYVSAKPESTLAAMTEYYRGKILMAEGKYEESEKALKNAAERYLLLVGALDDRYLEAVRQLSKCIYYLGRYEEAADRVKEVYETYVQKYGENDKRSALVLSEHSWYLSFMKHYHTALEEAEKSHHILEGLVEETDQAYLDSLRSLANAYFVLKRYEEALQSFQKVEELTRRKYGEDDLRTLTSYNNLAIILSQMGRQEEAMKLRIEVLEKRKELLGADHPETLSAQYNLAYSLANEKRYEEAVDMVREVWEKRRVILGEEHPAAIVALRRLKNYLAKTDRLEEQYECNRIYYNYLKESQGESAAETLDVLKRMIKILKSLHKDEEAEELMQKYRLLKKFINFRYPK